MAYNSFVDSFNRNIPLHFRSVPPRHLASYKYQDLPKMPDVLEWTCWYNTCKRPIDAEHDLSCKYCGLKFCEVHKLPLSHRCIGPKCIGYRPSRKYVSRVTKLERAKLLYTRELPDFRVPKDFSEKTYLERFPLKPPVTRKPVHAEVQNEEEADIHDFIIVEGCSATSNPADDAPVFEALTENWEQEISDALKED